MATTRYFILEQDAEAASAVTRAKSGLRSFGAGPKKDATPKEPVKVVAADISHREAAAERTRKGVRMVGRAMPMKLIAPRDEGAAPAAAPGSVAWGVKATAADKSGFDGQGVTVAVLDTGISAAAHPAFDGVEFEARDFTDPAGTAEDQHGHGTHCAGTIFGRDVGGTRIGIARGVERALIGKVLGDDGGGDSAMLFDALNWASASGANIVSMSLGFDFPGMIRLLEEEGIPQDVAASNSLTVFAQNLRAFDMLMASFRAAEPMGRNMLVVAAAGNESRRELDKDFRISASLPAAAGGVISVAAYGRKGSAYVVAPFSNIDAQIAAPGVDILSADLGTGLVEMSGTSQACPHVAGLAALWWQKLQQELGIASPDRVRENLFVNATTGKLPKESDEIERGRGRALAPS